MPPPTVTTSPAPGQSVTRADILALGRASRPWEFLRLAAQALSIAPRDAEIRFLAAANLAQLGLATLARLQIDALPPELRADPGVTALLDAMRPLAPDEIAPGWLVTTCGHNLVALQSRSQCLGLDTSKWTTGLARWRFCRALDGNIVRAPGNDPDLSKWLSLSEQVASARKLVADNVRDEDYRAPITLEGLDPPWQFIELARATGPSKPGYHTPIRIVQADETEFLDALAHADMTDLLSEERFEFFVGPQATRRLAERLANLVDGQVHGPRVALLSTRRKADPPVASVLDDAQRRQADQAQRLSAAVTATYTPRTADWWRRRYTSALDGSQKPLRVLIPTCRYSTFVVHASRDLAAAVERAGHTARLLIEPDNRSTVSSVAYHRAMAEFEPDLVVLINYPRPSMPGAFPTGIPHVAWLQDPMPHLFSTTAGAAMGDLDFLAGHLFPELFEKFGYPAQRVLPAPVAACGHKFSSDPAAADLRLRHECEIAYVSHHSQSPQELHGSLRSQRAVAPEIRRAFDRIFAVLPALIAGAMDTPPWTLLARTVREHARVALGAEPDERTVAMMLRNYAMPVAERMFRHEALQWAVDIAARRSWRLHLYGRGWENHPVFAPFAKGELDHGPALHASYQAAKVHLHMSLTTLVHQRVLECALSGGFPLCRMHRDAISGLKTRAQVAAIERATPAVMEPTRVGYPLADVPEGLDMAAQLQRLGYDTDQHIWISRARLENLRRFARTIDTRYDAAWLLGDLAGTTFWNRQTLENRLALAIGDTPWRTDVSGGIGRRVGAELTHDALFRRIVGLVAGSLGVTIRARTGADSQVSEAA